MATEKTQQENSVGGQTPLSRAHSLQPVNKQCSLQPVSKQCEAWYSLAPSAGHREALGQGGAGRGQLRSSPLLQGREQSHSPACEAAAPPPSSRASPGPLLQVVLQHWRSNVLDEDDDS
jgi:hypothetical protein